jgi:hydrogenase nickel incorporation protein HypB
MVVTKTDLLPHVPFSVEAAIEDAHRIQPELEVIKVCSLDGTGIESWCRFLVGQRSEGLAKYR